jgi:hypothetical protein
VNIGIVVEQEKGERNDSEESNQNYRRICKDEVE